MTFKSSSPTHTQHALPFGLLIDVEDGRAAVSNSKLEREFYVPDDEIGSKSEVAAAAFESLLAALIDAGFAIDSPKGHRAIEQAVAATIRRL